MEDTHTFVTVLGLVGMVVIGGALLSGPVERSGLPVLGVFLLLGLLIGPLGLDLVHIELEDPLLRVVSTLSLTLVLFTDAMTLDLREVRRNKALAALILGPGTLLTALVMAGAAWGLLGLAPAAAVIIGAAVASTDPVVLRGMLQGSGVSERLRLALRLESGMNDVLLLPIVMLALAFGAAEAAPDAGTIGRLLISLFVLGPLAGAAVGVASVRLLIWVRGRFGVRREYEALYVIGVALGAFAAAETLGGSGFLAAFAAGLVIASLDVELCDCFLEYGQITAEIALLFTYVLLGAGPIWSGLGQVGPASLAFAAIVLVARLPIFAVALAPLRLPLRDRLALGWYGPRGLGSLLLALLPVFAGLQGSEDLVAFTSLAVLISVAIQGGWPLVNRARQRRSAGAPTAADQGPTAVPAAPDDGGRPAIGDPARLPPSVVRGLSSQATIALEPIAASEPLRITVEQVRLRQSHDEALALIDVRSERSFRANPQIVDGALRATPEQVVATVRAAGVPADAWVVAYCT